MTELAIVKSHPTHLVIPNDLSYNDWYEFRKELFRYKQVKEMLDICFVLHTLDWLFWGENHWGEDASAALSFVQDELGWSKATYSNYAAIWRRFGPDRRYPGLGITMYQTVMGVEDEETADVLLKTASLENWSRARLRKAVKEELPDGPEPAKVTRKDIEDALGRLLRCLKPANGFYVIEGQFEELVHEAARLLDYAGPPVLEVHDEQMRWEPNDAAG